MITNPLLLSPTASSLVVVDIQEKLLPTIPTGDHLVWNVSRLTRGARLFDVPVLGTEQYPKGLGPTVPELAGELTILPSKLSFSCTGGEGFHQALSTRGGHQVLLAGIETHVCVLQTALDLMADGYQVFLAVDATGSRSDQDFQIALQRMQSAGVTLTTTETALFEWCRIAGTDQFKAISRLVRETFSAPD